MTASQVTLARYMIGRSSVRCDDPECHSSAHICVRCPHQGYRLVRETPLVEADLYQDGIVPAPQKTGNHDFRCSLCSNVKAHPVVYACGHSHCYACARLWLEHHWTSSMAPLCSTLMRCPPHQELVQEAVIAELY
ncbi:hypothetical protein DFH09DRAFT_1321726 [Mycena vulgaris]|nr:hypothetical protein DFH09DRAFT_1321726 [Mycena vulgaris]